MEDADTQQEGHTEGHTEGTGGNMVVVKVRETYDLKTTQNKMTVIAIHTPKPDIIKRNYPGLLMQCKAYRPLSADVRLACASVLPLDPLGVGTEAGDVAPEDVFNPILYKAMSNKGMSQLEARINGIAASPHDVDGSSAFGVVNDFVAGADDFDVYYGLLSNTHDWRHANPQAGLEMTNLRPFVYEMVYNVGDMKDDVYSGVTEPQFSFPQDDGDRTDIGLRMIVGDAKPMPFINCTSYSKDITKATSGTILPGFDRESADDVNMPHNAEIEVPYLSVVCGCIIVPPSRLHSLFFRMVVEWHIEFTKIRPIHEITDFTGLARNGAATHYKNYSYESTKQALTGSSDTVLQNDACMVSSNADINKVM